MQAVSDAFATAARANSKTSVVKVEFQDGSGNSLYTATEQIDGSVTDDVSQAVRRSGDVTFTDYARNLSPDDVSDLVVPVGNEIAISRGFLIDGVAQYCQLGQLGIGNYKVSSDGGGLKVSVGLYDRSVRIQRSRWTYPYTIYKGSSLATSVEQVLQNRWPDCPGLNASFSAILTASGTYIADADSDPWRDMQDLVASYGGVLYFDAEGIPTMTTPTDPTRDPSVLSFVRGEEGVITSVERTADNATTYSGVVITGESTDATIPISSIRWDDNPASPTYYLGKYGTVPYFFSSQFITTQIQADGVAETFLPRVTGVLEDCNWEQLVLPQMESSDVIEATDPVAGLIGKYSLTSLKIPLRVGTAMSATVKSRPLWTG